jgi:two-component system, cell cycle sensor histidine kinase and response regulator CckA
MEVFLNKLDEVSRQRLKLAIEVGGIGFWDISLKDEKLTCSARCKENYGRTENEELSYSDMQAAIHKEDFPRWRATIDKAIAECSDFEIEYRIQLSNDEIRWVLIHGSCSADSTGETVAMTGTSVDITERKIIEERLRKSQRVLANAQRIGRLGNWEWDFQTNLVTHSEESLRLFGQPENRFQYKLEENLARVHPEDQEYVRIALEKAINRIKPYDVEYRISIPGRQEIIVHAVGEMTFDNENRPLSMSGTIQDITEFKILKSERSHLSAQVKTQQQYLNNIIANLPGVIWETHVDKSVNTQQVDFVSDYIEEMIGYSPEEWLSKPNFWLELIHPDDKERAFSEAQNFLQNGGKGVQQYRWIAKNGDIVWVETHMVATFNDQHELRNIQGITMDISERHNAEETLRKKEEELLQAQKLESVGRLAGGIAHDFNNMLTAINGYSDLILKTLKETDPIYKKVSEIRKAGERSAQLTQQLLAFSRQQIMQTKEVYLNQIVRDTNDMLNRLLGEDIKIITEFKDEKSPISVDPGQMMQVILNLAINSRDAMPYGGTLSIKTENVDLNSDLEDNFISLHPGAYVKLTVSDTGNGMDESMLDHIFEPFYTTKEVGKGTGLGLATVYGIVKQSNGHIRVESRLNKGTTFNIYFPRLTENIVNENKSPKTDNLPAGSETVLLVEDEKMVRQLIQRILETSGYKIIAAENGMEALEICQTRNLNIDVLVTDVVMPEMGGHELAKKLVGNFPDLKVIYISGYTSDIVTRHGISQNGANFIQKPFSPDELVRKIRQLLN